MRWAVLLLLLLPLVSTSVLADFRPLTANVSTLAAGESVLIEGSWSLSNGFLEIRKNTSSDEPPFHDMDTHTKGIAGNQSRRRVRALVMNWRRRAF